MKSFGESAVKFFLSLHPDFIFPKKIELLLPFENPETLKTTGAFFRKFYADDRNRIFILGINPGRFGAGTTGIAFTDPIRLENDCGIKNSLPKKPELSSNFIYEMIYRYGGVKEFYERFFLSAVCPVGFISNGKNINYYDDKLLLSSAREFIIETLWKQIKMGANRDVAVCLGEGKNYSFLTKLNDENAFFKKIIPLSHPRFIMQYRRKQMDRFIDDYIKVLKSVDKPTAA